jgi:hypothetical protein
MIAVPGMIYQEELNATGDVPAFPVLFLSPFNLILFYAKEVSLLSGFLRSESVHWSMPVR